MSNTTINFPVLKNLVLAADTTAAALVTRTSKDGRTFSIWETPLKMGEAVIGKLNAFDAPAVPKLKDGQYRAIKALNWKYTSRNFISVPLDEVEKTFRKFYEDDQVSKKGNTNHVIGFDKAIDGVYIKLWVYSNVGDLANKGAVRAKLEIYKTTYQG